MDPVVLEHTQVCAGCRKILKQTAQLLDAARGVWEAPSVGIVSRVLGLMPESRRILVGKRIQIGGLLPARGPVEEFQIVIGSEDVSVRLLATPERQGWVIRGRLPSPDWLAEAEFPITISEDRFEMFVPSLEESSFELVGPAEVLRSPALSEVIADES